METYVNESIFTAIFNSYQRLLASGDPRVKDLWLMESPVPIATICIVYVYFVLSLGPRLMQDRKPFNLRNVLIVYNLGQSVFSAVWFYLGIKQWIKVGGWGFICYPVDYNSKHPDDIYAIQLCYGYFLSKISELCDTVFFVLKKKDKHVSFLHVFHHAAMAFGVWFGIKLHPGGNLCFFGLLNLFVHIWMYMYYMIAAMGPQYQKYIRWKKHLTQLQLIQFALVMIYISGITFKCNYDLRLVIWIICLDIVFAILFLDFYWKAYRKRQNAKELQNSRDIKESELSNGKTNHEFHGKADGNQRLRQKRICT